MRNQNLKEVNLLLAFLAMRAKPRSNDPEGSAGVLFVANCPAQSAPERRNMTEAHGLESRDPGTTLNYLAV